MSVLSRTAEQKTNHLGFPKPGELIEMTGTHALEASDRAIFARGALKAAQWGLDQKPGRYDMMDVLGL